MIYTNQRKSGLWALLLVALLLSTQKVATVLATTTTATSNTAVLSLSTTQTTAPNGNETIPVKISVNTGGNDIVVVQAVIRYNVDNVSVATSDIDLSNSVFGVSNGNTCVFPNDYTDVSLRGAACQIVNNDTTHGILSITLAMPTSDLASTQHGTLINSNSAEVATVNFHAVAPINSSTLNSVGLQYYSAGDHYIDSSVIADDGNGTDVSTSPTQISFMGNGDLNSDRTVNYKDYGLLHQYYGNTTCANTADEVANITGAENDGSGGIACYVNYLDYGVLHQHYGQSF